MIVVDGINDTINKPYTVNTSGQMLWFQMFSRHISTQQCSLISGLCYAEFSARLPRNGSAYYYSYVTLGELCGFVIGWNMILEHVVTATIAAKAWSQYVDFLANGTIKGYIDKISNNNYSNILPMFN